MPELSPRMFSFNNPYGACPECTGPGHAAGGRRRPHHPRQEQEPPGRGRPDHGLGQHEADSVARMYFEALARQYEFSLDTPWQDLPDKVKDVILLGTGSEKLELRYDRGNGHGTTTQAFEGLLPNVTRAIGRPSPTTPKRNMRSIWPRGPVPAATASGSPTSAGPSPSAVGPVGLLLPQCGRGSGTSWTGSSSRQRRRHRRPDSQGDPRPAGLPQERGPALPDPEPGRRPPSPAARPSESGWRPRSAPASWASSISWTSPPSACTSGTTTSSSPPSSGCGTWATPCWWWSTTRTHAGRRLYRGPWVRRGHPRRRDRGRRVSGGHHGRAPEPDGPVSLRRQADSGPAAPPPRATARAW